MEAFVNPARCCPECGSREFVFRGRKKIPANLDQPPAVERKYACKACGHTWKERMPVKEARSLSANMSRTGEALCQQPVALTHLSPPAAEDGLVFL